MKKLITLLVLAASLVLAGPALAQGPKGHVYIPRIGLVRDVVAVPLVDRDYDLTQLGDGVAWLEGAAWLEHDWARIVLAAHTPGAFETIRALEPGDTILVWDEHTVEVYAVTGSIVVDIDDVSWLMPTDDETLILLTCDGDRRLVVLAERAR